MTAAPVLDVLTRLAMAMGEDVTVADGAIVTEGWRLGTGERWAPEAFEAWNGIWEGFVALHGGGRTLATRRLNDGYEWRPM